MDCLSTTLVNVVDVIHFTLWVNITSSHCGFVLKNNKDSMPDHWCWCPCLRIGKTDNLEFAGITLTWGIYCFGQEAGSRTQVMKHILEPVHADPWCLLASYLGTPAWSFQWSKRIKEDTRWMEEIVASCFYTFFFLAEGLGLRGSLRHYKGQFCPPLVAQPRYFLCCISCCYIGHSWGFCAAGYPWFETVRLSTGLGQYFPIFIMSWQT